MKTGKFQILYHHNLQPYNNSFIGSEIHTQNNKILYRIYLDTLCAWAADDDSDFDSIAKENQL